MENWINRQFLGFFSFCGFNILIISVAVGIGHFLGIDKDIFGWVVLGSIIASVVLTIKTYRFKKRKDENDLNPQELERYYKIRRILWAYLGVWICFIVLGQNNPDSFKGIDMDGEYAFPLVFIIPGLIATFLILGIPLVYRRVASFLKNRRQNTRQPIPTTKNWFKENGII